MNAPVLRVFISSPRDVIAERDLAREVVEEVSQEFTGQARLEAFLWEKHPMEATEPFQGQIVQPSEVDLFVCILWSRLGTPLGEQFTRDDGTQYESGTEFEFELAYYAYLKRKRPRIYVYRKTAETESLRPSPRDESALADAEERTGQARKVQEFFKTRFGDTENSYVGAYNEFENADQFRQLLKDHLRQIVPDLIEQLGPGSSHAPRKIGATWTRGSPFRGLSAFAQQHASIFHGRRKETLTVLDKIRSMYGKRSKLLVVCGISGCGKTSLVQAGVLPALMKPGAVLGVERWRSAIMRPGGPDANPYSLLADSIQVALSGQAPSNRGDQSTLQDNGNTAGRTADYYTGVIDTSLQSCPANTAVMVVIDQLEELFTSTDLDSVQRKEFVDLLFNLAQRPRVFLVCTLRLDFLDVFSKMVPGDQTFDDYRLAPPGPAQLREMITEPAAMAALGFDEDDQRGSLADYLCEQTEPRALPLLEFTLDELYKKRKQVDGYDRLTFEALDELGGVTGALAKRAQDEFDPLGLNEDDVLKPVFRMITRVPGFDAEPISRPIARNRVEAEIPEADRLLNAFIEARLLLIDEERSQPVVRLMHESLLAEWQPLQRWLQEERSLLLKRQQVSEQAEIWSQEKCQEDRLLQAGTPLQDAKSLLGVRGLDIAPEVQSYIHQSDQLRQREAAERRWWRQVLQLLVALVFAFATLAGSQWWRASVQKQEAEVQRDRAELIAKEEREARQYAVQLGNANALLAEKERLTRQDAESNARRATRLADAEMDARERAEQALKRAEELADKNRRLAASESLAAKTALEKKAEAEQERAKAEQQFARAEQAREDAEQAREDAEQARRAADRQRAIAEAGQYQIQLARVNDLRQDDPALAMELLLDNQVCPPEIRDFTWSYLFGWALDSPSRSGASTSPSGTRPERVSRWQSTQPITSLAFSPSSDVLACGLLDGSIALRDRTTGKSLASLPGHRGAVRALMFSTDGVTLVSGGDDRTVRVWDVVRRQPRLTLAGHSVPVIAVDISHDRALILSAAGALGSSIGEERPANDLEQPPVPDPAPIGELKLWDANSGQPQADLQVPAGMLRTASFQPDTQAVFVVIDGQVLRGGIGAKTVPWPIEESVDEFAWREYDEGLHFEVTDLAFSADGRMLAVSSVSQKRPQQSRLISQPVDALAMNDSASPVGLKDDLVAPVPIEVPEPPLELPAQDPRVPAQDPRVPAQDPRNDGPPVEHGVPITAIAYSAQGRTLASGDQQGRIQLRDGATGKVRLTLREHERPVVCLAFAPDGTGLASISTDGRSVVVHNGLTGSAKIILDKAGLWRRAFEETRLRYEVGAIGKSEVASAATFLASAEAELAWEAGNQKAAEHGMSKGLRHAESWLQTAKIKHQEGLRGSAMIVPPIEMRERIQLALIRLNQPREEIYQRLVGIENSRLPVLRDVTGGLLPGKAPGAELALLEAKEQALRSLLQYVDAATRHGVIRPSVQFLVRLHHDLTRSAIAWAGGNIDSAIEHLESAIDQSEKLTEMLERMHETGAIDSFGLWHAYSLLVDTRLSLARLKQQKQGIRFSPSLADAIERTSLEAVGRIEPSELRVLADLIAALEQQAAANERRLELGLGNTLEYESMARRAERAKADLAWAQGNREKTREHLERCLQHAEIAARHADPLMKHGAIEVDRGLYESVILLFDSKLALARMDRVAGGQANE